LNSFVAFREWSTLNGFENNLQIDRIDNNKGYSPSNCRWVDSKTNNRNKRSNKIITAFNETKCITDWSLDKRCFVTPAALSHRLNKLGWPPEKAITEPRKSRKQAPKFKGHHIKAGDSV
jgi:hypothetical protein